MKNESIREKVLDYIERYDELSKQKGGSSSRNINTVTKLQVESNAINIVQNHFEREGFTVISVERDNVGWDLEARSGLLKLKLEVKGLSI